MLFVYQSCNGGWFFYVLYRYIKKYLISLHTQTKVDMEIKLQKCIALYNARTKKHNKELGRSESYNTLNPQRLGMLLNNTAQYGSIAVTMHLLFKGKTKTIKIRWIEPICEILEIDPNFMFGFPSKHDKDYNKLITNK